MLIVMLEDDADRIDRFRSILADPTVGGELKVSRTAREFVASYASLPSLPDLIALDHDLFTDNPNRFAARRFCVNYSWRGRARELVGSEQTTV